MQKLNRNTRFVQIRAKAGAHAKDTPLPPTSVPDADRFDPDGSDEVVFYWDGTTPGGTMNLELYVLDGIISDNKWVKAGAVNGLAPNVLATLKCKGASQCFLAMSDVTSATGTNPVIRAYAWHPGA